MRRLIPLTLSLSLHVGCLPLASSLDGGPQPVIAPPDASVSDAGSDAGALDGGVQADAGAPDAGTPICPLTAVDGASCMPGAPLCEYQAQGCDFGCRCLAGQWQCAFKQSAACERLACPATQPAENQPGGDSRYQTISNGEYAAALWHNLACWYDGACPTLCRLEQRTDGSEAWHCSQVASCVAACPAVTPLPGLDEIPRTCSAPANTSCAWQGSGCVTQCDCRGSTWSCSSVLCACPAAVPVEGSDCLAGAYNGGRFDGCTFGAMACTCERREVSGGWTHGWHCAATTPCPSTPPTTGTSCSDSAGRVCGYSTQPFCGTCQCGPNGWQCTASTCDRCPGAQPASGDDCAGLTGQLCNYPQPSGAPSQFCNCREEFQGVARWQCQ